MGRQNFPSSPCWLCSTCNLEENDMNMLVGIFYNAFRDNIFCLAVGIAVYDEFFSCMCAAEFLCALDVFARHTSSRITFLTLTIVGRSRRDVSSHQDVFQTFGFPEGQDFEDFTQFWVFLYIYIYIYKRLKC